MFVNVLLLCFFGVNIEWLPYTPSWSLVVTRNSTQILKNLRTAPLWQQFFGPLSHTTPHQYFVRAQLPTSACIFFLCILSQVLCVRHNQIYFHHSFRQHIPDHNNSLYNKVRLHITFYQSPLTRLMNLPLKAVFQYLLCPSPLLFWTFPLIAYLHPMGFNLSFFSLTM